MKAIGVVVDDGARNSCISPFSVPTRRCTHRQEEYSCKSLQKPGVVPHQWLQPMDQIPTRSQCSPAPKCILLFSSKLLTGTMSYVAVHPLTCISQHVLQICQTASTRNSFSLRSRATSTEKRLQCIHKITTHCSTCWSY